MPIYDPTYDSLAAPGNILTDAVFEMLVVLTKVDNLGEAPKRRRPWNGSMPVSWDSRKWPTPSPSGSASNCGQCRSCPRLRRALNSSRW